MRQEDTTKGDAETATEEKEILHAAFLAERLDTRIKKNKGAELNAEKVCEQSKGG